MAKTGLLRSIADAALAIDAGRKGFATIEKSLLKQRLINLPTAQNGYIVKQKKALANEV